MGNIAKSARKGQDCVTTNVFGWFYNISWKIIDKIHIFAQIEMMLMFCFFQVDDQMKLLQDSWSEMLILDHIHHR